MRRVEGGVVVEMVRWEIRRGVAGLVVAVLRLAACAVISNVYRAGLSFD